MGGTVKEHVWQWATVWEVVGIEGRGVCYSYRRGHETTDVMQLTGARECTFV